MARDIDLRQPNHIRLRRRMRLAGWLVLLAWPLVATGVHAEPLAFRPPLDTDQDGVGRSIAELAQEMLEEPAEAHLDQDPASRFSLQLATGQYAEAVGTYGTWRGQHPEGLGGDPIWVLEIYARAKIEETLRQTPSEQAFRKALTDFIGALDDRTALDAASALQTPVEVFQGRFDRLLAASRRKTAVTYSEALSLVRTYLAATARQGLAPVLKDVVSKDESRRYLIQDRVLIRTPEGSTLSAVVVRHTGVTVRQPTSLFFTIYSDLEGNLYQAKLAAAHGYIGVTVDARGKRLSPDQIAPWEHEVRDVNAAIDWISKQSWSDGQVGMQGSSYSGFAQWAALKRPHPALKTIVPGVANFAGFGNPMQNNVFLYRNYSWPFYVMNNRYTDDAALGDPRWDTLNQKWFASGIPYRQIDAIDGTPNPLLQKELSHPSFDKYYQAMQPYKYDYAHIDIPVLSLAGYYDPYGAASINYLIEHYKYNKHAHHYLVIGPYDHLSTKMASKPLMVEGYSIDPVAQIDSVELTYQWFDFVMRGKSRPELVKDRINYQVMGSNVWHHAPSTARMSTELRRFYISGEKRGDHYQLSASLPRKVGYVEQTVDFADRTTQNSLDPQSANWSSLRPITSIEMAVTGNALAFVSEPFDAGESVEGLITGQLDISINKRDFDFAMAAYELMPDGKLVWLSYYLGRASYADDMSVRKLLVPGTRTRIPFTRTPLVARQIETGSRLLLLLTVNKNAFAQVNYGTGKDVSDESAADATEPLDVRWYTDSYVSIPIRRSGSTASP